MTMENPAVTVSDADLIRVRLQAAELSQREAAQQLGIDMRTMRRYCAGSAPVPPLLFLALDRLGQIWRYNRVIEMLDDGMSTSDGALTREQFEDHIEMLRQANAKLLRAINFIGGEPDLSETSDLDTFDGWLKHQGFVVEGNPEDLVNRWRAEFESGKSRRMVARSAVFFNQPCPAGEYRYAVAIEDGAVLRLALVVRRSRRGEYFVLMPRDGDWNPHASYHLDGRFHHKSYDHVLMPESKPRPRLDQFKGTQHLGSFLGFGTGAAPICNPTNFTSVLEVPPGILESMHGCVLIDLVDADTPPNPIHRQHPGLRITHEETYRDGSPWLVIAISAQSRLQFDGAFVGDRVLGCLLWATEPPSRRVRFSIGPSILVDILGAGNPVVQDRTIALCEHERPRIETACRQAFYDRPGEHIELQAADFQ